MYIKYSQWTCKSMSCLKSWAYGHLPTLGLGDGGDLLARKKNYTMPEWVSVEIGIQLRKQIAIKQKRSQDGYFETSQNP